MDGGFELGSKISHARVKRISKDPAEGGELGGVGRCRAGLLQTQEFVLELGSALSVLINGRELFEERVIVSE